MTGMKALSKLRRFFKWFLSMKKEAEAIQENRKYVRSFLSVPILLDTGQETADATTFDISEHGLYVRTTHLLQPGASLKARFTLPNGKRISCVLQVVWTNDFNSPSVVLNRPPGFGAIFSEISDLDREAIRTAVQMNQI
jgi:hypothetical protein